jgi:hypothetical protein
MELSVVIEPTVGQGFRATSGDPLPATAEGVTKAEALQKLRDTLTHRVQAGAEVVRIHIETPSEHPVWPQDSITDDWLAGITEARAKANARTDEWDTP